MTKAAALVASMVDTPLACIAWLYTVALSPGLILSFAVLHIENFVFQCATLQNWP